MGRHEKTARTLASLRRQGVALTGLAMIVAGGIWAAVAWAASDEVEITKPSGNEEIVRIEETHPDWKTYRYDGVNKEGRSLASVLKEVGVGDRAWTSIEVSGLTVQNGSFEPKKPPIFYIKDSNDEVTFYRPKTENSGAESRSASGGDLDMSYRVPLEIEASDNSPKAGQTVTYEASVPDGGPKNAYEFTWTPSSGSSGKGPKFEYTYPETSGEVTINVTAERGSDSETVGSSTAATTTIEAPPEEDTSGSNGFGSSYDSSYNYTPPATDYDSNFPEYDNSDSSIPDDIKTPDPDEAPPVEDFGTSVSGELLSATAPLPPSSGDASEAPEQPDPEAAIEEAEEINAPGALIAAGVVVGLLGLGAGREMETMRPRRIRRPDLSGLRRLLPPWK